MFGPVKTVGAFALGSVVGPVVLWGVKRTVKRTVANTAKTTVLPVVTPMARDALKKVIAFGYQIRDLAAEAAAEV